MSYTSIATIILSVLVISGCGGKSCEISVIAGKVASCSSNDNTLSSSSDEFVAAASKGELVKYKINRDTGTYEYTIISSAYGLDNVTRRGNLSYNQSDDTYSPIELTGKISYNAEGLFYGLIQEQFDPSITTPTSTPVFGLRNPGKNFTAAADTYNYISYQCIGNSACTSNHGTLKIHADGSWQSCQDANLADESPTCTVTESGIGLINPTTGIVDLRDLNSSRIGNAMSYANGSQKVFIVDLTGGSIKLGKGIVVASAQNDAPASIDGVWRYIRSQGAGQISETGLLKISGLDITQRIDGGPTHKTSFKPDSPWKGFATTLSGTIAITAGSGMYAAKLKSGNFSVGLKKSSGSGTNGGPTG